MASAGGEAGVTATGPASGPAHDAHPDAAADISFYPLTFPMILGPGSIASIVIFTGQADGVPGIVAAIAVAMVIAGLQELIPILR